jgi:hypothetical protein
MTRGATVYYNTVTGVKTRTRPKMEVQLQKEARKWQGQGAGPLDANGDLLNVAFPSSYPSSLDASKPDAGAAAFAFQGDEVRQGLISRSLLPRSGVVQRRACACVRAKALAPKP